MTTATLAAADERAHDLASYRRTTRPAPKLARRVIQRFPAGEPRGNWQAEDFATEQRRNGVPAAVVMDIATDSFLVVVEAAS